jgi:PAS domain S-box-containing protein
MPWHGRALAIAAATVLFAAIFVLRLAAGDPNETLGLSYAMPVALAAVLLGRTAGLVAAATALLLWIGQRQLLGADIDVAHVISRAVTFGLLGGLVGHFVERGRLTQRQLHDAEGGYRDLLERVPAIVYTAEYGAAGRWSYVSPKIESILGHSVDEWIANPEAWYSCLHPDDREQALAAEERSKATGEPLDSEYRMIAKDGQVLWFRDQATVVHDDHGRPAMMQGVMLDITSRKRAEDELELRYAVQKGLAEAASLDDGLHRVLRTVAVRFGWKLGAFWVLDEREEQLRLTDFWHADDIAGDPFENASRALRFGRDEGLPGQAWAQGEPIWIEDISTEPQIMRRAAVEAGGLRAAVACPVVGGNRMRGVVEFFADERRGVDHDVISLLPPVCALLADFVATRAAIEEHRGRFQAVLDNAPAVVFAQDLQGRYLFVNRRLEEVIGRSAADIEGKTNYDLFPRQVADELSEHDRHVIETDHQGEFEEVIPHADGVHTYLTVKFPLYDATGTMYAVCGISTDVTELKRVQQDLDERAELERANRAKSEFLSRVSHELRTPLNAILGFGQVLEVDSLTDRQRNSVEQIMKGGRHLLELVNDLLELSRIESGAMRVSLAPLDVAEAVNDIVLMVEPLAAERAISICREIDAATPIALADEQRVKQVLLNLISNAIKYNRDGGRVEIAVQPARDGRIAARITDTGQGIAGEDLERLFSPFERLGAEQTAVEGTGLGLALSRLMVEAMQGSLTVSSAPGRGSTFTVELPSLGALSVDHPTGDEAFASASR